MKSHAEKNDRFLFRIPDSRSVGWLENGAKSPQGPVLNHSQIDRQKNQTTYQV
jgi:hypothetical protein